ncbi:MAG: DUF211 domain-containing protein [Haloferacaceae archaeon]
MAPVRRLVLDLLKPYEPSSLEFAADLSDLPGVDGVNALLVETDQEVQNVKLTIEGDDVDFDRVADVVERLGGSIHSLDQVVCGERFVEESATPQD